MLKCFRDALNKQTKGMRGGSPVAGGDRERESTRALEDVMLAAAQSSPTAQPPWICLSEQLSAVGYRRASYSQACVLFLRVSGAVMGPARSLFPGNWGVVDENSSP